MHPLLQCVALLDEAFERYLVRFRVSRQWRAAAWSRGEQVRQWRAQGHTYRQIALKLGVSRGRCEQINRQHQQRLALARRSFCQLMQARLAWLYTDCQR